MRPPAHVHRLAAVLLGLVLAGHLWALPETGRQTKLACITCHSSPAGGVELTEGGQAFQKDRKPPAAVTYRAAEFAGSDRCQSCHIAEHRAWQRTAHAAAFTNLVAAPDSAIAKMAAKLKVRLKAHPAKTDDCVKCHVTGFQLAGGYPAADSARNVAQAAVGCESCHGPGSRHITAPLADKKKTIHRPTGATLCVTCHTKDTSPGFDHGGWLLRGTHDTTGE